MSHVGLLVNSKHVRSYVLFILHTIYVIHSMYSLVHSLRLWDFKRIDKGWVRLLYIKCIESKIKKYKLQKSGRSFFERTFLKGKRYILLGVMNLGVKMMLLERLILVIK